MRNALRNHVSNIELLTFAVSDDFGLAALPHVEPATNSGHVIIDRVEAAAEALQWEPVATIPLDSMRAKMGRIALIKLDIEGAEFRACKGAAAIIKEDLPIVFLEFTPILLRSISKVEPDALLLPFLELGYSVDVLHQKGPSERIEGNQTDIIERVIGQCNDVLTHVDLRLVPPRGLI